MASKCTEAIKLLRHMCIKILVFEFQLCKRYVTFKVHM